MKKYYIKMKIKRSALVIITAAVLLSSLVGVASAVSQNWYMLSNSSTLEGADCYMQKGSGSGPADKVISHGSSKIWGANEPVSVNQIDMAGQWDVHIYLRTSTEDVSMTVEIGKLNTFGTFILAGGKEKLLSGYQEWRWWNSTEINPESFSISNGESLAVRVTNNDATKDITVCSTGSDPSPSYIASPSSDPGYPVPELPTIVLTSMGVLLLVGFAVYSRRRNIK